MLKELNKQAEIDLKDLLASTGHELCVDDLPAVFDLNAKASRVTNLSEPHNQQLFDMPVKVGGVWLQHPTVARLAWLEHHDSWMCANHLLYLTSCAFACSVDTGFDTLETLLDEASAKKAVLKFGRRIKCSLMDLAVTIKALLLFSEDGGGDATEGYWNIISFMVREYGCTPQYWRRDAHIGEIVSLMNEYKSRREIEANQYAKANAGKAGIQRQEKVKSAESLKAVKEYRDAFNELKRRWADVRS